MAIVLSDDGTLDTVLECNKCGKEFRFNYDPGPDELERDNDGFYKVDGRRFPTEEGANIYRYNQWVDEIIKETADEHVCEEDDDES